MSQHKVSYIELLIHFCPQHTLFQEAFIFWLLSPAFECP